MYEHQLLKEILAPWSQLLVQMYLENNVCAHGFPMSDDWFFISPQTIPAVQFHTSVNIIHTYYDLHTGRITQLHFQKFHPHRVTFSVSVISY
jgi:hypothetical protein